jgi:hypothetical protein
MHIFQKVSKNTLLLNSMRLAFISYMALFTRSLGSPYHATPIISQQQPNRNAS